MASEHYELAQSGVLSGRPEGPALEAAAAEAIEEALRELIERRYLYQKLALDYTELDAAVKAAVDAAIERAEMEACQPTFGGGAARVSIPKPATVDRLRELHTEIETRPWRLNTRHMGDNRHVSEMHRVAQIGAQPRGTPTHEMNLKFYVPAVELDCPGRCKGRSLFVALVSSSDWSFDSPFPRRGSGGIEQIFVIIYRCEKCREMLYTILIRRVGGRLHLCGFAPRREPPAIRGLPAFLLPILNDAEQSVAEGDTNAGFYHLRTMLEHYLKNRLEIPLTNQVRGDDLVAKYYDTLSPDLRSTLPPLTTAWEKLSEWLHTRTGEPEDYQGQREALRKHIQAMDILGK